MANETPEVGDKGTLQRVPARVLETVSYHDLDAVLSVMFFDPRPVNEQYNSLPCFSVTEADLIQTASWNWNGSAPSGTVAEKKDEGEVAVQSKRGNTIKKAAKPDDPAVHLARPGNDVVKNQSELNVEEKKADDGADDKKGEDKDEGKKEEATNGEAESAKTGEKRKAEDEAEAEGEPEAKKAKARGRPKGSAASTPAKKAEPKKPAEKKSKPAAAEKPADSPTEKKKAGRPKKEGGAAPKAKNETKAKKTEKPKAPATGIGKRTRSGGK